MTRDAFIQFCKLIASKLNTASWKNYIFENSINQSYVKYRESE